MKNKKLDIKREEMESLVIPLIEKLLHIYEGKNMYVSIVANQRIFNLLMSNLSIEERIDAYLCLKEDIENRIIKLEFSKNNK